MLESKVAKYPPGVAQKIAKAVYIYKVTLSNYPKKSPNIWVTFERIFVAKNFKKLPNLVTLKAFPCRNHKTIGVRSMRKIGTRYKLSSSIMISVHELILD